jgi:hypothetical protein
MVTWTGVRKLVSTMAPAAILRATWRGTGIAVQDVVCIAVCVVVARMTATAIRRITLEVTVVVNLTVTSTGTPRAVGEAILRVQQAPEAVPDVVRPLPSASRLRRGITL